MNAFEVIKTVRLTEKGTRQSEKFNQYTVVADKRANKIQIRQAAEELFKVDVTDVSTMNVGGKLRRHRVRPDPHGAAGFAGIRGRRKALHRCRAGLAGGSEAEERSGRSAGNRQQPALEVDSGWNPDSQHRTDARPRRPDRAFGREY